VWLSSPVEERDGAGKRRMSGGKSNRRGAPQGGAVSPLLANLYMNRFLKFWRLKECGKTFRACVVNSADDFVILSRGKAAEALAWTRDLAEERPCGRLRFPGLHVRAAIRPRR
jgi:RNA-directed DNA polymerase